ncbi:ComEC/Rec2 family competence protein [Mucilaginibacter galii]|uniref:Competence protein n=1 Tax=Mucilaginibacter galii TaxID=2005073 RepID=A0A917J5K6_9SPHI|nr:ComEC/Rec2 family competence protein [Mucilaginibacter galii]GGI48931.1 competence protein [Mucilaginibacter galii]
MLRAHKGEIPFLFWLMPFIAGVVLNLHLAEAGLSTYISFLFLIAGVSFIVLNICYNKFNVQRYSWLGGALMHIILLCSGWLCAQLNNELPNADHFSKLKADYLIVKVITEPTQKGIYTRFTAQVNYAVKPKLNEGASGKLLITLVTDSNSHAVSYGDLLLVPATYKPVDIPFNPAEFNYKKYLAHQNIYHQSFLNRQEVRLMRSNEGNPIIAWSLTLRQRMVDAIKLYITNTEAAAIASTLLLGYKADLSSDILQAYSKTGTIHVLSVSGAHVAILFVVMAWMLKPLRRNRNGRILNAVLSLLLIWAYAILTGLSPAVCRAAVMLSMVIISKASGRPVHYLNVLAVSAFALLLYNPLLITDVGFQLSYLAVFGLIALQPILYEQFEFKNKWADKLWKLCSLSIAAQLITFPLSAYYFHQFPVYFLVSNLLIIVPAEVIVIVGMTFLLSTLVTTLAPLSKLLAYVLEHLILLMNKALVFIEHLPYASISKIWISTTEHLLLYLIIIAAVYFLAYKKAWQLHLTLAFVLVLCCSLSWKAIGQQSTNHTVFFNVRKNSAVLFQTGHRAVVVTDLLPADKNYKYSIQPCLDSLSADSVIICNPQQNLQTSYFKKQLNLIRFLDKSVVLFNPSLQNIVLPQKIQVDYLFFTHNPHSKLAFILKNYAVKHLVVDANNSNQRINNIDYEADSLHLKINILKRNKSFILVSK